jgi:anaphase-promoting complex subunit 3
VPSVSAMFRRRKMYIGNTDVVSGYTPEPDTIFPDPPISTTLRPTSSSSRQQQPSQSQVRPPTLSPNPMPRSSASEMPGLLPARRQLSPLAGSGGDGSGGFFTPDVAGPHAKLGMKGPAAWE